MIPKTIHYIWIGGTPLPDLALKCLESWRKLCPSYEIKLWNETNLDLETCLFVRQAYEHKKYGFATDYLRLKILYDHGGIYLDTDVEILKPFDELLHLKAFFGFENELNVNTGAGFGAEKGSEILVALMNQYESSPFKNADGSFDLMACPQRDTPVLRRFGCRHGYELHKYNNVMFFPSEYFSPINYNTGKKEVTENTFSIHHYMGSWKESHELKEDQVRYFLIKHLGERFGKRVNNAYLVIKERGMSGFASYVLSRVKKIN